MLSQMAPEIFHPQQPGVIHHLQCAICLNVVRNCVHGDHCDHIFCRECIQSWQQIRKKLVCPSCNIVSSQIQHNTFVDALVANLQVLPCSCGWKGTIRDFFEHRTQCQHVSRKPCAFEAAGCLFVGTHHQLQSHLTDAAFQHLELMHEHLLKVAYTSHASSTEIHRITSSILQLLHGLHGKHRDISEEAYRHAAHLCKSGKRAALKTAWESLWPLVKKGHRGACEWIGRLFLQGLYVAPNDQLALAYLLFANKLGRLYLAYDIASLYERHHQNSAALQYYRQAAEQNGDIRALLRLARCYHRAELGCSISVEAARSFYDRVIQQTSDDHEVKAMIRTAKGNRTRLANQCQKLMFQ